MANKCDCTTYYLFGDHPMCLHKLFQRGLVKIITREVMRDGTVEFWIFRDKPKDKSQAWKRGWWKNGTRSRLHDREQILLAIELSEKHQVRRVRL